MRLKSLGRIFWKCAKIIEGFADNNKNYLMKKTCAIAVAFKLSEHKNKSARVDIETDILQLTYSRPARYCFQAKVAGTPTLSKGLGGSRFGAGHI